MSEKKNSLSTVYAVHNRRIEVIGRMLDWIIHELRDLDRNDLAESIDQIRDQLDRDGPALQ